MVDLGSGVIGVRTPLSSGSNYVCRVAGIAGLIVCCACMSKHNAGHLSSINIRTAYGCQSVLSLPLTNTQYLFSQYTNLGLFKGFVLIVCYS